MLNKTIEELSKISDSNPYALLILKSIKNNTPDLILKKESDNLYKYLPIYKKYNLKTFEELKNIFITLKKSPAIDIIIVLHLIGNFSKPSNIKWPEETKRRAINLEPTRLELINMFKKLPTRTHNPDIVEYASRTIIATGVYRGLQFSHDRAPYLKRPMWCLSPESPYTEIAMMFPAQSGKTFTANTAAMYHIEAVPSEILYATSDETMAMKWLEREISPRAANAGIIFKSEVESRQSRKTGNTSYSKTFPGGVIDIASALSPSQMASATKRIVLGDEVDRWKVKLGEQGTVINQLRARTQAWGDQAKIFWFSTPNDEETSSIYLLYKQGTQEMYYVPCPHCGTYQLMDFMAGKGYGLTWEKKDGHIYKKSIELICENQHCGRGIKESAKPKMLLGGEWRPTAIPEYEHIVSFNINGLYSFQLSWYDMVVAWEEAQKSELKRQDFEQLKMGRPFKRKGTRPKVEFVIENNRHKSRRSCDVPEGVLYLTAGIDVQRGSKTDPNNPPRLEMEVLGIGIGHRTWSIEYRVFEGSIDNPFQGAWEDLFNYMVERNNLYTRSLDGFQFPVSLMFIDSGDGEYMDIVYMYSQRWTNAFPSKGFKALTRRKKEKPDEVTENTMMRYRPARMDGDITLYEISTAYYKAQVYANLKVKRIESDLQNPGFCDFPADYSELYFEMLTAEELTENGYDNKGRRNEALDCRVYSLCAGDVYLASVAKEWQSWAIENKKMSRGTAEVNYTKTWVLNDMAAKTAVKKIEKK